MQVFSQYLLRKTVVFNDFAVKCGTRLRSPFKGLEVHIHETEAGQEGTPFVVVHQRPVEIAAHIHAPLERVMHR